MQHVNNDMDDLFRKAGEQYPLNSSSSDWSRVHSALTRTDPEPPLKQKKEWHRAFYLLFLIPFIIICNQVNNNGDDQQLNISKTNISAPDLPVNNKSSFQENSSDINSKEGQNKLLQEGYSVSNNIQVQKESTLLATRHFNKSLKQSTKSSYQPNSIAINQDVNNQIVESNKGIIKRVTTPGNENVSDQSTSANQLTKDVARNDIKVAKDDINIKKNELNADIKKEDKEEQPSKASKSVAKSAKRFYAGALFGPDITTVKLQKVTDAGLDFGFLLGYNISSKLSLETGIISSRKEYYANGEYLSKYSSYLPSNIIVTYGEGSCRMIELPVQFKYSFNPESKNDWFISAGTSSYFMKKEDYEYYYKNMTTGDEWSRERKYENSSKALFAVAEISGGISKPLGKFGDLRIQPYIKLPLRKVGFNELPLTSGGVHLVLSKKIF